jgi:hypothetical protein
MKRPKRFEMANSLRQAAEMERSRSYLERGRRFRNIPEAELQAVYARSGNACLGDGVHSEQINFFDSGAEYRLRELQPPDRLLSDALDKFAARLRAARLSDDDLEPLYDAIDEHARDMDKPKN